MTWQAIAGGANGLLYYSAHHIFKYSQPGEPSENWNSLVKVAEEVKSHLDVLLSDEIPSESSSSDIVVRAFRKDGEVWMVVANCTRAEAFATVAVAGVKRDTLTMPALGAMVIKVK